MCEEPAKSPLGRRSIFSGNKGGFVGCYELDPVLMLVKDKYTETNTQIHNWPALCEELGEEPSGTVKYFL